MHPHPEIDILEPNHVTGQHFIDAMIQQTFSELREVAKAGIKKAVEDYLKERNMSGVKWGISDQTNQIWFQINVDSFVADNQ